MTKRLTALAVGVAAAAAWSHAVSAQRPQTMSWKVGDDTRYAIVFAPPADPAAGKRPLVFASHGRGDDMQNFQYTFLHRSWPEAVTVYFQGLPASRDGLNAWQAEKGLDDDRDLKVVDAALASLREKFSIDVARVYATGFSNGANFTYLLWAERPQIFAAYAPVAGRLRPSVQPSRPKPILHIGGTEDTSIRFADQLAAIEVARKVDGATADGASCGSGCTLYGGGSAAPVMTWIHPGGHTYPNSVPDRIASFFKEHRLVP
jgi:polyhydroxybutyrate depolymerase